MKNPLLLNVLNARSIAAKFRQPLIFLATIKLSNNKLAVWISREFAIIV